MKQRKLATAAAALLVASAVGLAGCGSGGNGGGGANGGGAGAASDTNGTGGAAGGKQVEITFWNTYNQTSAETKQLQDVVIPAFEKAHPNIKVKNVPMPADSFSQKLLVATAGAELPDAARIDIVMTPQLAKLGTLVEQDSLPGFDELKAKVFPGPLSTNLYKDKYYGIPLDTNTKVLLYNPDMLQKAGLSGPPKTMDEFIDALGKLSGGSGAKATFGYDFGVDLWWICPWLWSNGTDVLSPDLTKATGYMNGDKTIAAIDKLKELGAAGQATGYHNGDLGGIDGLAKGKYAMIDDGPWSYGILQKQYPDFKFEAALYPAGEGGSIGVVGGENYVLFNGSDKAHQEAAYEFEKFMLSDEAQIAMAKVGQMPVVSSLSENAEIKAIGYYDTYMEQLKTAKARPSVPQYAQIDKIFSDALSQILLGKKPTKDALDAAAKQCDALLAQ